MPVDSYLFAACCRYGHVFLWDSGSSVGEISGHSKFINGIDYRPVRPFRVVTAGEDKHVNFYEGPPFRYKGSFAVSIIIISLIRSREWSAGDLHFEL